MSDEKPKRKLTLTNILLLILIPISLCGVCSLFLFLFGDTDPTVESEATEFTVEQISEATEELVPTEAPPTAAPTDVPVPSPTATQVPTATPMPTADVRPTTPIQPTSAPPTLDRDAVTRDLTAQELALREEIDRALGASNRTSGRKLDLFTDAPPNLFGFGLAVGFLADDAPTNTEIRQGLERDTLTVLRIIADSGIQYDYVGFGSLYPMYIPAIDITDELEILTLSYSGETLRSVDWSDVSADQVFDLADLFSIDPAFE